MKSEFFYETFSPKRLFFLNVYLFCMKIDENCWKLLLLVWFSENIWGIFQWNAKKDDDWKSHFDYGKVNALRKIRWKTVSGMQ